MTGIDDHSGSCVCAGWWRGRRRGRCVRRWRWRWPARGAGAILTDNGKVFTARFGPGPGPVMFDRICADNGIRHLLTAPYSPTTTGKVERLHKTMRREFFTVKDRVFATIPELQAALDGWVIEYNTERPHQSFGGRPPAERFALADRSIIPADRAEPAPEPPRRRRPRPAGVSRWVNAHGKISLAGFSYRVGATYAGEPVEVVVASGLVDILHAGVVVATHAQRLRDDQPDRAPRAPVARRARDATAGLTVTRLADGAGVVSFAGTPYACGRGVGPPGDRRVHRRRIGPAVQGRQGHPGPPHPPRPVPRTRRVRQPQRTTPPQELRHRQCRLTTGTQMSPGYPNLTWGRRRQARPAQGFRSHKDRGETEAQGDALRA